MVENWKPIGEAQDYAVSDIGRVKRILPDRLGRMGPSHLATPPNDHGYPVLNLHINGKQCFRRVHILVCTAFHGPKPSRSHEVLHADGDKTNNRADNLRWGTSKENTDDCRRHGKLSMGESRPNAKLTVADVIAIRAASGPQSRIASEYGIGQGRVSSIKRGASWKHVS